MYDDSKLSPVLVGENYDFWLEGKKILLARAAYFDRGRE